MLWISILIEPPASSQNALGRLSAGSAQTVPLHCQPLRAVINLSASCLSSLLACFYFNFFGGRPTLNNPKKDTLRRDHQSPFFFAELLVIQCSAVSVFMWWRSHPGVEHKILGPILKQTLWGPPPPPPPEPTST